MQLTTRFLKKVCFWGLSGMVGCATLSIALNVNATLADEPAKKASKQQTSIEQSQVTPVNDSKLVVTQWQPPYPFKILSDTSPTLVLPANLPDEPLKQDEKIQQQLRAALLDPTRVNQTGDPILDGVMDAIRQRGSIVATNLPEFPAFDAADDEPSRNDGFPTPDNFPRNDGPRNDGPRNDGHPTNRQYPVDDRTPNHPITPYRHNNFNPRSFDQQGHSPEGQQGNHPLPAAIDPIYEEHRYHLAEQLLMTARLLSADGQHRNRKQLIQMLREEAARCLNTQPNGATHNAPFQPRGYALPNSTQGVNPRY